jgi:A/G-specific adenine glycosylase
MKNMDQQKTKRLAIEKEWATYKYNVMERNYSYYKSISKGLHDQIDADSIKETMAGYLSEPLSCEAVINTLRHVWGYFRKEASESEKVMAHSLIDDFSNKLISREKVKVYLANLAVKYKSDYLLESHFFDDMLVVSDSLYSGLLKIWYDNNRRDLPWRRNTNPYHVWISEIMCQQTQVATVIGYYNRFLAKWPDIYALSLATEDEVFKMWEGLGYYGRARRMMQLAHILVADYSGEFPSTYEQIIKLPGIGAYPAGAILSICFEQKVAAVDGNVMRVISRVFNSHKDIALPRTKAHIEQMVLPLLPDDVSSFNQGLMELGALVCTPTNPDCSHCPFEMVCIANRLSIQNRVPVKSKARKKIDENVDVMLIICDNQVMITKASSQGLLGGLWGLPYMTHLISEVVESETKIGNKLVEEKIRAHLKETYAIDIYGFESTKCKYKHVFTHKTWEMRLHVMYSESMVQIDYPEMKWVRLTELDDYPISTAFRRLISKSEYGLYLK